MKKKKENLDDIIWHCRDCESLNFEENMQMVRTCPSCESPEVYAYRRLVE